MSRLRLRLVGSAVNAEFIDLPHKLFTEPLLRPVDRCYASFSMNRFVSRLAVPAMVAGITLCTAAIGSGRAGETHSFIIAANDGYGIEDCLGEGGECGHVVANAWCEAHGLGAALGYGRKGDLAAAPAGSVAPYVVICGD
jgi:hypothetical protein